MANVFEAYVPKRSAAPTAVQGRQLQNAQAGASIANSATSRAATAQDMRFNDATERARIEKVVADAQAATVAAEKAQQQKGFLDLKEQQALAAARATLMMYGEGMYKYASSKGYEPTTIRNRIATMAEGLPLTPKGFNEGLGDLIRDDVGEVGKQGERVFTEGALRTVTGSAGPKEERPEVKTQYFPSAWQNKDNKYLRARLQALRSAQLQTAKNVAGPALSQPASSAKLPAEAVAKLKEGQVTTFGNGQRWTMVKGVPQQVQ